MKRIAILIIHCILFFQGIVFAQNVGIGTIMPHASSKLDISSNSSGVLIPRMSTPERNAIINPAVGLLVYDKDKYTIYMYNGKDWFPLVFGSNTVLPGFPIGASDGVPSAYFGYNVSISGDLAIVGAPLDSVGTHTGQGSAYIFYRSSNGWIQQAKLTASDGEAGDGFGVGVAISGNYAVIGAYADDVGNNTNQGSAYIFFYNGSNWVQQAKLVASDGESNDFFGTTVSINGNYAVIGAYTDKIGANMEQGSAYIFYKGSGWTTGQPFQSKLIAPDGAAFDNFGIGAAIHGDYAIVGASHGLSTDKGSAYIYGRIGTNWIFLAEITASDGQTGDFFGYSVDINGDYAIVGAAYDFENFYRQGSAYIFYKGSGWTTGQPFQAKLTAPDGAANDQFGNRVSISGDYVVIGAYYDDTGTYTDNGSAYLYKRNGAAWNLARKIEDFTGTTNGSFGIGVGISGYNVIIGAIGKNNNKGEVTFLNIE